MGSSSRLASAGGSVLPLLLLCVDFAGSSGSFLKKKIAEILTKFVVFYVLPMQDGARCRRRRRRRRHAPQATFRIGWWPAFAHRHVRIDFAVVHPREKAADVPATEPARAHTYAHAYHHDTRTRQRDATRSAQRTVARSGV